MRRLVAHRDDSGVATIFVVIALPVLILFAALVLDGGRAYIARRETQNSADAAALAMATDCAMGLPTCVSGADTTAGNYKRSTTQRSSVTNETVVAGYPHTYCDMGDGLCKATMQQSIGFRFALGGGTVTRSGIARWGGIQAASVPSPITIAACEFDQSMLAGNAAVEFFLDDPQKRSGCSSPSGGFGRLTATDDAQGDPCITKPVQDASGDWVIDGKAGNDLTTKKIIACFDKVLNRPNEADRTILIPLYDDGDCGRKRCQANDLYPIKAYAMLLLKGYLIKGEERFPAGPPAAPSTDWCMKDLDLKKAGEEQDTCIIGDFVETILPANLPNVVSGGPNFGATRPYLSYS